MSFDLVKSVIETGTVFSKPEKFVLIAIAHRANSQNLSCYPGYDEIGWLSAISRSSSIRAISSLVEKSVIAKMPGGGRATNRYYFNVKLIEAIAEEFESLKTEHKSSGGEWLKPLRQELAMRIRSLLSNGFSPEDDHEADKTFAKLARLADEFAAKYSVSGQDHEKNEQLKCQSYPSRGASEEAAPRDSSSTKLLNGNKDSIIEHKKEVGSARMQAGEYREICKAMDALAAELDVTLLDLFIRSSSPDVLRDITIQYMNQTLTLDEIRSILKFDTVEEVQ